MNKRILILILVISTLTVSSAAAQDFYKSRPFPLGNLLSGIQERAENLIYISEEDWDVNAFVIGRNVSVLNAEHSNRQIRKFCMKRSKIFRLNIFGHV